VSKEIN
jgi:hypothetical protein